MERTVLLTPRMLCSVSVSGATWRTVPDLRRTNPGMERSGPTLTALRRAAGPGGSGAGGAPPTERNAIAVGLHHATFARLRVSVCMWSQNVRRLDASLPLRLLLPAGL